MLKKALLSTALVASSFVTAAIKVDFDLAIQRSKNVEHVATSLITENNKLVSFENDDVIVDILAQAEENDVLVQANVYQRTETEVQLIAQPVIKTTLNEDAGVALADEAGDTLTFVVNVSHVEEVAADQVE